MWSENKVRIKDIAEELGLSTATVSNVVSEIDTVVIKEKDENNKYYKTEDGVHCTAGLGFKLIMNHNMVVSFEAAKALESNDGTGLWSNIGFNYLF